MKIILRRYYKHEVAELYQMDIRTLLKRLEGVQENLKSTGYSKYQKIYTIAQVEIIFKHLGDPLSN